MNLSLPLKPYREKRPVTRLFAYLTISDSLGAVYLYVLSPHLLLISVCPPPLDSPFILIPQLHYSGLNKLGNHYFRPIKPPHERQLALTAAKILIYGDYDHGSPSRSPSLFCYRLSERRSQPDPRQQRIYT